MSLNLSRPILYLITRGVTTEATTPQSPEFRHVLEQVEKAVEAGVDLIQIREKKLSARVLFELSERAVAISQGTPTRILVNDRADIAAGVRAAGVHLTTQSLETSVVRETFGDKFLVGVSTHSFDEARAAFEQGSDFVVFGPIFPTLSKQGFGPPVGLQELNEITNRLGGLPLLALGGVSENNAQQCLKAGAGGVAGISLFSEPERIGTTAAEIRMAAKGL